MNLRRSAILCAILPAVLLTSAQAANWPQWRGPFLNGSTDETGLPAAWTETDNVAWSATMPGPAASTPIVWGDRVFVTSVDRRKNLLAICLDAPSGKIVWQERVGRDRPARSGNNMASPAPVTDGKTVYFYYGTGDLVAFDFGGKRIWSRQLEKDHGHFVVKYGYSASPLLFKGKLYIPVMQNKKPGRYDPSSRKGPLDSFILAIDPNTGRDIWKHVRPTDATDESTESYSTIIPFESGGRSEIIVVAGEYVTGHDPKTGAELWRWEFKPADRQVWQRVVSTPVAGDGLIYAPRPKHRGIFAIRGGGNGRLGDGCIAWKDLDSVLDCTSPLLYGGRIYLLNGDRKTMTCLDAKTGRRKWQGKLGGSAVFRGSPTAGDGKIYCISEAGEAIVLAAGDEFKILSRVRMGGRRARATIAISGGRLFIRTSRKLWCIAEGTGR